MPSVNIVVVVALVMGAINLGFVLGRVFERADPRNKRR